MMLMSMYMKTLLADLVSGKVCLFWLSIKAALLKLNGKLKCYEQYLYSVSSCKYV